MKRLLKLKILFITLFAFVNVYSQSISFVAPQNGQTITYTASGATETTIPVNCSIGYNETTYPQTVLSFTKLYTHNNTYSSAGGGSIPQWFYLTPGTYTWRAELFEAAAGEPEASKTVEKTITFYVKHTIQVKNDFNSGTIKIDGSPKTSGSIAYKFIGNTLGLEAIDQSNYIWNTSGTNNSNWQRKSKNATNFSNLTGATSRSYNYTVVSNDNGATIQADMKIVCSISFENNHTGSETGGSIKVNGTSYTSPTTNFSVVEEHPITGYALDHEINGISFSFVNWTPGNYTSREKTYNPTSNMDIKANFSGRPTNTYRNQYFNPKVVGQPIKVYWSQHPNTNVTQYKVYRKPKYGSESCVGTFARTGTSSYVYTFTDPDMVHTNSSSSYDLYYYDVRAYYSPDGTYSDYDFKAVYAEMGGPIADDSPNEERMQIAEKMYEYGISNYPNPYNPTTTINYQIKEMGNVNITVFDALGRTVKVLVNDIKQPGEYNILFDGSNLSNGVYYYRMQAGKFVETKKMIMMK